MQDSTRTDPVRTLVTFVSLILLGGFAVLMAVASPFGFLLLPALVGGVAVAAMFIVRGRRARPGEDLRDLFLDLRPTGIINVSRIRVAGFGGLGLIAMALVVATVLPRIGETLLVALAGGLAAGVFFIVWRKRRGPLESSSQGRGGRSVLLPAADPDDDVPTPTKAGRSAHLAMRA